MDSQHTTNTNSPTSGLNRTTNLSFSKFFQKTFDCSPIATIIVTKKGSFLFWNKRFLHDFEFKEKDVAELNFNNLVVTENNKTTYRLFNFLYKASKSHHQEELQIKNGNEQTATIQLDASLLDKNDPESGLILSIQDITSKTKYFNELATSEKKYRSIFDNMLDGAYQASKDGKFISVNPAMAKMLGYSSTKELLKIDIPSQLYINSSDRQDWIQEIEHKEVLTNIEMTLRRKDGSEIMAIDNARSVYNDEGEFLYFEGILTDITALKRATQRHNQSRANLLAVIENTQDSIWSVDKDYRILIINSVFQKAFKANYGVDLVKGVSMIEQLDPQDQRKWKKYYDRALRGEPFSIDESFKINERQRYVELSFNPIISESSKITGVTVFVHDITDLKEAIKTAEESREMFRLLFENAPIGIVSLDIEGNILQVNNKLLEIVGAPNRETIQDLNICKLSQLNQSGIVTDFQKSIDQGRPVFSEKPYTTPWGKETHLHYCFAPIVNKNGKIISIQGIIEDISERKKATDQLFESYKYLGVINRKLGILLSIGRNQMNKHSDEIAQYVIESALELSNASDVIVYKFNQSLNKLRLAHTSDKIHFSIDELKELHVQDSNFLSKIIIDQNRVQQNEIDDIFKPIKKLKSINFILGIPLIYNNKTIGVVFLIFEDSRQLTTQELDFYEVFAMQASNALYNAKAL